MTEFNIVDAGDIKEVMDKIQEFSDEFDRLTFERHEQGEQKYGPGTWLTIDTLQHAMDEVLDLANYARFTYVKLRLLQDGIKKHLQADGSIAHAKPGYDGPMSKLHTGGMPT